MLKNIIIVPEKKYLSGHEYIFSESLPRSLRAIRLIGKLTPKKPTHTNIFANIFATIVL
jgi:hypothetical protein